MIGRGRGRRGAEAAPDQSAGVDAIALLQRVYEAFGRRDLAAVLELVTPDVEVWQSAAVPWGGTFSGVQEFRDYAGRLLQHVDARVEPERLLDAGTHAVMIGRSAGRVWRTGARFDVPVVHVWTLRDGRLARLEVHMDTARMLEALAAVGDAPQPSAPTPSTPS